MRRSCLWKRQLASQQANSGSELYSSKAPKANCKTLQIKHTRAGASKHTADYTQHTAMKSPSFGCNPTMRVMFTRALKPAIPRTPEPKGTEPKGTKNSGTPEPKGTGGAS